MKSYSVHFRLYIHEKSTSYPEIKPIDISVTENLPQNVDAQVYLRRRLSEELTRAFMALPQPSPIENHTEDKQGGGHDL